MSQLNRVVEGMYPPAGPGGTGQGVRGLCGRQSCVEEKGRRVRRKEGKKWERGLRREVQRMEIIWLGMGSRQLEVGRSVGLT